jgi:IrrE N-terminal-like domain
MKAPDDAFWDWAEDQALYYRRQLHLLPHSPLPAFVLAKHLGIRILKPQELTGITAELLQQLLSTPVRNCWSAFTIPVPGQSLIVHNPTHSPGRRESNLMHEISHVLCQHVVAHVAPGSDTPFAGRRCSREQEREATTLGACLLLPTSALHWALQRRMREQDILCDFVVSRPLLQWRLNRTGLSYASTTDS